MRREEEAASSPAWMTTMGDLNTLLLVFFVMLFTMMMTDKGRAGILREKLGGAPTIGPSEAPLFGPVDEVGVVRQAKGYDLRVQRLSEGIAVTIGSEGAPFAEGSWTLTPAQREILEVVKAELRGTRKMIEIRGHTSGNRRDSVVFEAGAGWRSFDPARDREEDADWIELATLRARAAYEVLAAELPPERLRIRADGYSRWIEPSADWDAARVRNQRVEVVLTNEAVRE